MLFDRYYASYELMFQLLAKGSHFVFRMKDDWWKCVDTFIKSGQDEQIVYLQLPAKLKYLLAKYPHLSSTIKVRLIKKTNRKGKVQVFCTSLIDKETYSRKSIINLYKQRWGIEEAYKLIKSRLGVAGFSGLTAWTVQQDFYAKTMLLSLCNIMCSGIEPKPGKRKKPENEKKSSQPRVAIINRTYTLSTLKNIINNTAFSLEKLEKYLLKFIKRVSKEIVYSRRNQSSPGNIKLARKYSMAYKSI